ncbi:Tartrate-resistant acid ATPase [Aphelenchoides besseyi]|nr:Tartrate-resistant acid ATPase [Aphelenchoides besseyi]
MLEFWVLGIAFDVGKLSVSKPTHIQLKVVDSMVKLAEQEDLDMIVNVGDNWFMVAGNHDHLGNVEAQIAYTDRSNKTFPSLYYKTSYSFGPKGTRVEFVFIDTVVLCGNSNNVKSRSIFSWIGVKTRIPERPAAKYVNESKKQWKWIEEQLRTSTADHLFVVGHYPIHSVVTKTLQCLKRELDPLMRKYKVGAYFAGHNHNLQVRLFSQIQLLVLVLSFPKLLESPIASELGVGEGGFVYLRIEPKNARLRFYARDLQMEHEDLIPSRQ